MGKFEPNNATTTNYSSIEDFSMDPKNIESVQDQKETFYTNERIQRDWSYFYGIPKLQSAIIMKGIWTMGKGYTCDIRTKTLLDHIVGDGKQTFHDILFNMIVMKQVVRDSFAEIIRDPQTDMIVNIRILDPSTIRIVYDDRGMIKRYDQMKRNPKKGIIAKIKSAITGGHTFESFDPKEIFHLSNNNLAGQIHGISVPEMLESRILADQQNFLIMKKLTAFQAVPFIIFKVKSDDATTIATFKANIKDARQNGEDLIIPDDENLLSWETVVVSPSSILMEWRNSLNNEFYQAVGMPQILFGSAGSTESGGKIEYLGHETVFEYNQRALEKQIEAQLGISLKLNSPTSLIENLQKDESKDNQSAVATQPNDTQAGVGA